MNIEQALDTLYGPREEFRKTLQPEELLKRICWHAKNEADKTGVEPWTIISKWTSHGSGVSNAIYQLYKEGE